MSKENDNIFMVAALNGFFRTNVIGVLKQAAAEGYDATQGRFRNLLPKAGYTTPISAWLAQYYAPVANAMFDGATVEKCLAIWRVTKARNLGAVKKPDLRYNRAAMQAGRMAREEYAKGWRSRSDWRTVK